MTFVLLRRVTFLRSITNPHLTSQCCKFSSSRGLPFHGHNRLHLSPLFSETGKEDIDDGKIEVVDDATWHVSSSLIGAWRANNEEKAFKMRYSFSDREDGGEDDGNGEDSNKDEPDFDEIQDMRIRGNLFYKLDKASKEYEEYKFDFHERKLARNKKDVKENKEKKKKKGSPSDTQTSKVEINSEKDLHKEIKKKRDSKMELLSGHNEYNNLICRLHDAEDKDACTGKKQRTPTFNQLTAPYHEPFCLDIYISKGSVRASIIHRATSKVVAVSHSISKDMKFDLASTKNRGACAAVGKVLAQRALDDDIHNIVYTPRKGEKLEGKLQIVLKSIVDGGVDVKVKLKQMKLRQRRCLSTRTHDQK